ncbi:MAG TPA: TetR family transcriptional regulator, partial [Acidimicrobiaceae bacterium]|nr:TetR family transcriptional regulator [Acidimicrobiaceae bacterium]
MSRPSLDPTQVIEEAARLADTKGLDALTLTRVAEALGVQQP